MRRRALLGLLGAAALAWPARAQQAGRFYRIGVLTGLPWSAPNYQALWGSGLRPAQYAEHAAAVRARCTRHSRRREPSRSSAVPTIW